MRPLRVFTPVLALLTLSSPPARATTAVTAPATIAAGATVTITFSGDVEPQDFITIVAADTPEGKYDAYTYANASPVELWAPDDPGKYEIRLLGKDGPYPTKARQAIEITPVTAVITGPTNVTAGARVAFEWTGPNQKQDFLTIVEAGAPERTYKAYVYAARGSPSELLAPEQPGSYEARYLTGQKYYTLGRHAFTVGGLAVALDAPNTVVEGAKLDVGFTGNGNPSDFLTIVRPDAAEKEYKAYAYAGDGSTVQLTAPEEPGAWEIRYLSAQEYTTIARRPLEVGAASATLSAADEVVGGIAFPVAWTGPANGIDYITIVAPDAAEGESGGYRYVHDGNPANLRAPLTAGEYELRYSLGATRKTLARRPIRVTPPTAIPGELRVVDSRVGTRLALAPGSAVEMILDASGSMAAKLGKSRRIDIAKDVLTGLVRESLPAGTPFALRVFGNREARSCRTDLEAPLAPLEPASIASKIASIEPMDRSKTPIAASLELVAQDLASAKGPCAVVLVTDGEETCGGDPAATISALRARGLDVRVSLVGFAIDDAALRTTFRYWADLGGGEYHDANEAGELAASIRSSLRAPYDVLDGNDEVVASGTVGGDPVVLPAGSYRVRVGTDAPRAVAVVASEAVVIDLGA